VTLRGSTGEFPLEVVLRLLADQKKTGELSIRGQGGEGALGLAEGRVVTAVFGDEQPIPALGQVFQITEAQFEFTPWNDAPTANLEGDLQDNLRKAAEYREWMASVRQVIPNDSVRFRLSERAAEQGAVTFTSDRWRVVLAVNGERDVNSMASHLHLERDAALTTLAGLVRDGVIETMEAPAAAEPKPSPVAQAPAPVPAPVEAAPEPAPAPPQVDEKEWSASLVREAAPEPAPEPPPPAADAWAPPATTEPAPREDRLAALFNPPAASDAADPWAGSPAPTAPAAEETDRWSAPAPSEGDWMPAAAEPAPLSEHDAMRLSALTAPPPSQTEPAVDSHAATDIGSPSPSEWAPPPVVEAPAPKKKGLFGLGGAKEKIAPVERPIRIETGAASRAGLLAALSNALITEYNSGDYGKGRVEGRIPSLLMRVDEQADPIDKPLPVVDDRLDVQALERVALPEQQAVPYLALLVSTIYGDAEKVFGRDKAKRGYRTAQQRVFAGDTSALSGPDLAGKLPKI
jgi:hypothetical protein